MEMVDLINPEQVIPRLKVTSKKQVLQELARRASEITGQDERHLFDILLERERLGSTGMGGGIAIPHGRIAIPQIFALFAKLDHPVEFDAIDEQPVDLVFLLLTPENSGADHLKALARISRLLRDRATCDKLRGAERSEAIYALLIEDNTSSHAA